jgi:hypothetical protein
LRWNFLLNKPNVDQVAGGIQYSCAAAMHVENGSSSISTCEQSPGIGEKIFQKVAKKGWTDHQEEWSL